MSVCLCVWSTNLSLSSPGSHWIPRGWGWGMGILAVIPSCPDSSSAWLVTIRHDHSCTLLTGTKIILSDRHSPGPCLTQTPGRPGQELPLDGSRDKDLVTLNGLERWASVTWYLSMTYTRITQQMALIHCPQSIHPNGGTPSMWLLTTPSVAGFSLSN